jgi:hypothetical protein
MRQEKPTATMFKIKRTTPTPDWYKCTDINFLFSTVWFPPLLSTVWFPPTIPSPHTVFADTFEAEFPSPHLPPTPNPQIWNDRFQITRSINSTFTFSASQIHSILTNWIVRHLFYSLYKYDILYSECLEFGIWGFLSIGAPHLKFIFKNLKITKINK